jgi:hypothetical protein
VEDSQRYALAVVADVEGETSCVWAMKIVLRIVAAEAAENTLDDVRVAAAAGDYEPPIEMGVDTDLEERKASAVAGKDEGSMLKDGVDHVEPVVVDPGSDCDYDHQMEESDLDGSSSVAVVEVGFQVLVEMDVAMVGVSTVMLAAVVDSIAMKERENIKQDC